MMISTRGRYALRVMLDMAEHGGGEWPYPDMQVLNFQKRLTHS